MTSSNVNRRRNLGFFFDAAVAGCPTRSRSSTCSAAASARATYRQLDERMDRVASHAGAARAASGRARRHAGRQPRGVHRVLLRRDAGRRHPAPAQHAARRRHARSASSATPAACSAIVEPCSNREALAIVAARAAAPSPAARPGQGRLARLRDRNGEARASLSSRRRSPTMRRPSSPTRRDRPAARRARS